MRQAVKLVVVAVLFITAAALVLSSCQMSGSSSTSAKLTAQPTPPANTAPANSAPATPPPASGGTQVQEVFHLGLDSQSEQGEVIFNHRTHTGKDHSIDGKIEVTCTQCHHTNQPASALKPPDKTSTSDTILTLAAFQAGQKVQNCRTCHFQDGNVPDGKEMPQMTTTVDGNTVTKDLNNQLAYHINCNTCHDAAVAARPELRSHPGFATTSDCMVCHKHN